MKVSKDNEDYRESNKYVYLANAAREMTSLLAILKLKIMSAF